MARLLAASGPKYLTPDLPAIANGAVLSFSAWYRPTTIVSNGALLFRMLNDYTVGYYVIFIGSNVHVGSHTSDGGYIEAVNAHGQVAGTWVHVGAVWDRSASTAYSKIILNGVQVASASGTRGTPAEPPDLQQIGAAPGSAVDGRVAELALWDRELTAREWAALGKGASPSLVAAPALTRYWPLIRDLNEVASGTLIQDFTSAAVADHCRVFR